MGHAKLTQGSSSGSCKAVTRLFFGVTQGRHEAFPPGHGRETFSNIFLVKLRLNRSSLYSTIIRFISQTRSALVTCNSKRMIVALIYLHRLLVVTWQGPVKLLPSRCTFIRPCTSLQCYSKPHRLCTRKPSRTCKSRNELYRPMFVA